MSIFFTALALLTSMSVGISLVTTLLVEDKEKHTLPLVLMFELLSIRYVLALSPQGQSMPGSSLLDIAITVTWTAVFLIGAILLLHRQTTVTASI